MWAWKWGGMCDGSALLKGWEKRRRRRRRRRRWEVVEEDNVGKGTGDRKKREGRHLSINGSG